MKLTINAQVYDTQKVILVTQVANEGADKLRLTVEKLYLSGLGNWFLHGKGGALSEYAQHRINSITSGERLTPITEDEALDWCELNLAQAAIERHFGHLIQDA